MRIKTDYKSRKQEKRNVSETENKKIFSWVPVFLINFQLNSRSRGAAAFGILSRK